MCRYCCSHRDGEHRDPHSTSPTHLRLLVLRGSVHFPGERLILDIFNGALLRLLSDVGSDENATLPPFIQGTCPRERTRGAFAIAAYPDAPVGAIARFDPDKSSSWVGTSRRVHVIVTGRYRLVGKSQYHCMYPCISAHLICEHPSPPLLLPLHVAFPFYGPRRRTRALGVSTRRSDRSRFRFRHRSSLPLGGLSIGAWRLLDPPQLVQRVREAATAAHINFALDELLLNYVPKDGGCPARWSFWLSAALSTDAGFADCEKRLELLGETCTTARLRQLLDILKARVASKSGKKRSPVTAKPRTTNGSTRRFLRNQDQTRRVEKHTESSDGVLQLKPSILKIAAWPISKARGFGKADSSSCLVRGRFRVYLPDKARVNVQGGPFEGRPKNLSL